MKEWVIRLLLIFISILFGILVGKKPPQIIRDVQIIEIGCTEVDSAFARLKRQVNWNTFAISNFLDYPKKSEETPLDNR